MKTITPLFLLILTTNYLFSQYSIGHYQTTFQDPSRNNRAIQTEIYYPATASGDNTPSASGQFPVIVFGHGFVMAWDAYENLWTEFVSRGYIMVFPRTEGNAFSTDHQQFGWDLQFLVSEIQLEGSNPSSSIYGAVHPNTALMGHSMGGGATFLAADSLCTNGNINLKTLIGLAPAESTTNGVSSIHSAKSITVPSVIFSGSQDGVTPPIDHHIPMYDSLSSNCKTFVSVLGGGHCYFANSNFNCDFGESTSSTGISITRSEQHQITFDFVNNWLDYTLKDDCLAFQYFEDSVQLSARVNTNQVCSSNPVSVISENSGILNSSVSGISYQWYFNGSSINGATSNTYSPTAAGNYSVEVYFTEGCPTLSLPYNFTPSSSSILEHTYKLQLYPNPTRSIISFNDKKYHDVNIFSLSGVLIENKMNTNSIDLSSYSSGLYLFEIDGNYYRVVKE